MTDAGPVNIKLTAEGISEVISAFKNLEAAATRLDKLSRAAQTIAKNESKARLEVAKSATIEAKSKANASTSAAKVEVAERKRVLREFEKAEKEKTRIAKREAAEQERVAKQLNNRIVAHVRSSIASVTRLATMGLSLAGGLSLANAFGREMAIQRSAAKLSVASNVPGHPEQYVSTQEATASARQIAQQYNVSEEDVLDAQHAIVAKTGRGRLSANLASEVTKIGKAEGVDYKELGEAVGVIAAQNPNLTDKELVQLMKILVAQGKVGSVELADMARVLPVALSKASKFEGNQGDNQVRLASLLQIAIKTTGSPEQAAIAIKHLSEDIVEHQKKFTAKGINVRGADGQIRNINLVVADTIDKTHANAFAMKGLFGERSGAVTDALSSTYLNAEQAKKGSGRQAVLDTLETMNREALTEAQVQKDLATVMKTDAEKVSKAMNDLDRAIRTRLVPSLLPLIEGLDKLVPTAARLLTGLGELVNWIAEHPWTAAFAAMGGLVTKAIVAQLGSQLIGSAISNAIMAAGGAGNIAIAGLIVGTIALATVGVIEQLQDKKQGQEKGEGFAAGNADILRMDRMAYELHPTEANRKDLSDALTASTNMDASQNRILNEWNNKSTVQKVLSANTDTAHDVAQATAYESERTKVLMEEEAAAQKTLNEAAKMMKEAADKQMLAAQQLADSAQSGGVGGGGGFGGGAGAGPRSTAGSGMSSGGASGSF